MNAEEADFKLTAITDSVLSCFYTVYNTLGYGFLEKVYHNALVHELGKQGLEAVFQHPIPVFYDGKTVGDYFADIVVNGTVIIEIKAAKGILPEHEAQLLNYLRATDKEVGLILNFGPSPQIKRKAFDNSRKNRV